MLKRVKIIASTLVSSATLFVGNRVFAALVVTPPTYDIPTIVSRVLDVVLGGAALVSVIYIIIGGFSYITSAGNAEKVGKATQTITYAVIGLVVVALAFAIKSYAIRLITGGDIPVL